MLLYHWRLVIQERLRRGQLLVRRHIRNHQV